jgi:signal transduction histidine kinase
VTAPPGPAPPSQPFRREVRHFVFGALAFVLFLAAAALVGLRASTDWALRQHEEKISAQTLALAARVAEGASPAHALGSDTRTMEELRHFHALEAAVYDGRGILQAQAAFLPWASAVSLYLPAESLPAGPDPQVVRADLEGTPAVVSTVRYAPDAVLRLVFDGGAVSRARWAGDALTAGVGATALLLALLTVPFLRRLLQPIEELTETARHAGALVPPATGGGDPDEPRQAVATFARTIEELRRRSEEVEVLRLRELAALGEMSAGIAHEFRNATATILGYVRLASGDVGELARKRHLEAIRSEAEHVARVTGDFLFFARPGSLDAEPTRLDALVREVVDEEARNSGAAAFSVEGDFGDATVDPLLVRRALVNLLRNAAEAVTSGGRSGRVLVRGEEAPGLAVIAVEDDGPGVPPSEAANLFVPFHSTKDSGTGLGLALVSRIAALHGGSAGVEPSARLGGARFTVTLRRDSATFPGPSPSSSPPCS